MIQVINNIIGSHLTVNGSNQLKTPNMEINFSKLTSSTLKSDKFNLTQGSIQSPGGLFNNTNSDTVIVQQVSIKMLKILSNSKKLKIK